ncbi:MAG: leucine-rich repeat domain-containing protein, partial [Myxococcota bacterium]
ELRRNAASRMRIIDGKPHHGDAVVESRELAALLGTADLSQVTTLKLQYVPSLTTLDALEGCPELTSLSLLGCSALSDVFVFLALPKLAYVDMSRCTAIKPRPSPTELVNAEAVRAYRAKLARALKKRPTKTDAQQRWLAAAEAEGLLGAVPKPTPALTHRQTMARIRELLSNRDSVLQGLELAAINGDERIRGTLFRGFHTRQMRLYSDSEINRRINGPAAWVALNLMRVYGMLDERTELHHSMGSVPDLNYLTGLQKLVSYRHGYTGELSDLSPLTTLPALRNLSLTHALGVRDLLPLASTQLTSLSIAGAENLTDLSPLAMIPTLTQLNLSNNTAITDLSPLSRLTRLESLDLRRCRSVKDVSALVNLTNMRRLILDDCPEIRDLSPLSGMTQLETLHISRCPQITDLAPLDGIPALKYPHLHDCIGLTQAELRRSAMVHTRIRNGTPHRAGEPLRGARLLQVLHPGNHLDGMTSLTLAYTEALTQLNAFATFSTLSTLHIDGAPKLTDAYGLIPLTGLSTLTLSSCTALRPRPKRVSMDTQDDVTAYRKTLARSLKRRPRKTADQRRWLTAAREEGLI